MRPALKQGSMKTITPMILALFGTIPIGFYFVVAIEPEIGLNLLISKGSIFPE